MYHNYAVGLGGTHLRTKLRVVNGTITLYSNYSLLLLSRTNHSALIDSVTLRLFVYKNPVSVWGTGICSS